MKRWSRFRPAGLAAAIVLTAALAAPVAGCLTPYRPAEHFERTDLVLTGVAVDRHVGNAVEGVLMLLGLYSTPEDVAYDIVVDRIEKGGSRVRDRERVTLHVDGFGCAQRLEVGHRYRIGATGQGLGLAVPFGAIEELPLLPGPQPATALTGDAVRVTLFDLLPILQVLVVLVLVVAGLRLAWARFHPTPSGSVRLISRHRRGSRG